MLGNGFKLYLYYTAHVVTNPDQAVILNHCKLQIAVLSNSTS